MKQRIPWDAARVASQRRTRKYKPVGPVGVKLDTRTDEMRERCRGYSHTSSIHLDGEVSACSGCGYHVCGCKPRCPNCGHALGDSVCPDCRCEVGPDGYRVNLGGPRCLACHFELKDCSCKRQSDAYARQRAERDAELERDMRARDLERENLARAREKYGCAGCQFGGVFKHDCPRSQRYADPEMYPPEGP